MNHKPVKPKPHEDLDGMAKTKSAIILIHLQDEMMPIYLQQGLAALSLLSKDFSIEFGLNARYPIPEMRIWIVALYVSAMPS